MILRSSIKKDWKKMKIDKGDKVHGMSFSDGRCKHGTCKKCQKGKEIWNDLAKTED